MGEAGKVMMPIGKESLVSIIPPGYNGSDYLREAIGSALAQTYPKIEIVVVNDGSQDEGTTRHIVLSCGDKIRSDEALNQ